MISSDYIRGYNDLMILSLLRRNDDYAYSLSKQMDYITKGMYVIKETTLYSAFTRLENNGFIESYYVNEQSGGTKRKYYHISKKGIEYLEDKLIEWKITKDVVNNVINWREENE